jgi:hypothetical protein
MLDDRVADIDGKAVVLAAHPLELLMALARDQQLEQELDRRVQVLMQPVKVMANRGWIRPNAKNADNEC